MRFANGGSLATWAPDADEASLRTVQLQGAEPPLTLRLQDGSPVGAVRVKAARGPDAEGTTLTPTTPSVTLQDGTDQLQVGLREVPGRFSLQRSAPNPASERATIAFSILEQTRVEIALFDVLGRKVTTLTDGERMPGQHDVRFDVQSLPSGTYFYRMSADGFSRTRRLNVVH